MLQAGPLGEIFLGFEHFGGRVGQPVDVPQQHRHFGHVELFQQALIGLQCTRYNRIMGGEPDPGEADKYLPVIPR
jgi:hypothetical protein